MEYTGSGLKFSITIHLQIFKTLFEQFCKKYAKNNYFGSK